MSNTPDGAELAHNAQQVRYFEHDAKPRMVPRPSRYLDRHLDELLAFGGFTPDDRLLEIGAGMGRYTIPLLRRGYRVEACDLSEVLLSRLQEYARPRPVTVHQVDAASPPQHLHGQFDGVIGLFMLHHVHDVEHCLKGVARMLKPGRTSGVPRAQRVQSALLPADGDHAGHDVGGRRRRRADAASRCCAARWREPAWSTSRTRGLASFPR